MERGAVRSFAVGFSLLLLTALVAEWCAAGASGRGPADAAPSTREGPGQRKRVPPLPRSAWTSKELPALTITYPLNEAVFPPGFPCPAFTWRDSISRASVWRIVLTRPDGSECGQFVTKGDALPLPAETDRIIPPKAAGDRKPTTRPAPPKRWRPNAETWKAMKRASVSGPVTVTVLGLDPDDPSRPLSRGEVKLRTSSDPVGALIFYRDLPLPFIHALKNLSLIRWRLGDVSSARPPRTLLKDMKVCANCHSFTPDGKTLAMDVDYANDKGSYVITAIAPQTVLTRDKVISWSDYRREDKHRTFGLLSQISPDGRYVASTVRDRSVFSPIPDLHYSQRFFPIKGILAVYDRRGKRFFSLAGADEPRYVQSNPVWAPDGKTILFARTEAYELKHLKDRKAAVIRREEAREFFVGGKKFRYDLYRMPFNAGAGGEAAAVPGASGNRKSNYFPRFSPDGKWIVFCQADSFMLLQPDSLLYIMPAEGGTPRQMRCNSPGKMNSWHSWSPNGRWLVFASKANGPYTQLWLTHVDADGHDAPPVLLEWFTAPDRAANIPEFVDTTLDKFALIRAEFADYDTYLQIGLVQMRLGQHAEAVKGFRSALQEKPGDFRATFFLGMCLKSLGQDAEALRCARSAVRLDPNHAPARGLLGLLLSRKGQYKEAIGQMEASLRLSPGVALFANNLAWLLATCPDGTFRNGRRAVELARQACKAGGGLMSSRLDTLAAAYAEVGRFDAAIRMANLAIEIERRELGASTEELVARLRLYQARRPYRQPRARP